jgi:hypothetical protein
MADVLDRAPPAASVCDELPCFSCRQLCAWRALKEIADTYLRARRGEPSRAAMGGVLPMACCRRQRVASVDAMIV